MQKLSLFIYFKFSVLRIRHMYNKNWELWYKSSLAQLVRRWTIDPEMRCKVGVQIQVTFSFFFQYFFFQLVNFFSNYIFFLAS